MLHHTMIVSFDSPIPDDDLNTYLKELETLMRGSGLVETFAARQHVRVPGDEHSPVFVADAVVRIGFPDAKALAASFAIPGVADLIARWQSRHPYKVVWVNHEPLP
ncbi:hypothetical protein [Streptomyces sp. SID11385]|uniref:hypothetical protein n=1 Tax=Streptomyces sp. SID11385 TaxID=2706031 RepID=UPI0013CB7015|nr:hypothetical protein [Streptomyces sp. SID11385]NEA42182.1 hypothetical protein [Streptomyces sp. SID11385]